MMRALAILLSLIGATLVHAATVPVTACGQVVGSRETVRFVADGNRYAGLFSYEGAHVSRSHLTGSAGADLATFLAPRVVATTCDHSAGLVPIDPQGVFDLTGPPWGVCSGD